jgi:hypothetical protein
LREPGEIKIFFFLSGISGNKQEVSDLFYGKIESASVKITPEYK